MSVAAALLALLAAASAPERIPPVDQCAGDASFVAFRSSLIAAVDRRDAKAVMDRLADDVVVDLGGGQGKDDFFATWSLARPDQSPLWDELGRALRLGCALRDEVRIAPSLVTQLDPELDVYRIVVAVAPGAAVRREATAASELLTTLDWDVLDVVSIPDAGDYIKVALRDGRRGFVRRDQVRSPLERRLTMARVGGQWRITTFVAGD